MNWSTIPGPSRLEPSGIFLARLHRLGERPTMAITRDAEPIQWS